MQRAAVAVAVAAIVGALWYLQRPPASTAPPASEDPPPAAKRPRTITKVTKLASAAERKQLADRIANAQAARAAATPASSGSAAVRARPPNLPPAANVGSADMRNPESIEVEIRMALKEVVPMLAECYRAEMDNLPESINVVADLTLTGDPDIGAVIDAHQLFEDNGKPLPAKLDDCVRSTLQLLALPPLAEGDNVEVRNQFVFAKQ